MFLFVFFFHSSCSRLPRRRGWSCSRPPRSGSWSTSGRRPRTPSPRCTWWVRMERKARGCQVGKSKSSKPEPKGLKTISDNPTDQIFFFCLKYFYWQILTEKEWESDAQPISLAWIWWWVALRIFFHYSNTCPGALTLCKYDNLRCNPNDDPHR